MKSLVSIVYKNMSKTNGTKIFAQSRQGICIFLLVVQLESALRFCWKFVFLKYNRFKQLSELYCNEKICHFPFYFIFFFLSTVLERQEIIINEVSKSTGSIYKILKSSKTVLVGNTPSVTGHMLTKHGTLLIP